MAVVVRVPSFFFGIKLGTFCLLAANACTGKISSWPSGTGGNPDEEAQSPNSTGGAAAPTGGNGGLLASSAKPGAWVGPQPFHRIGNEEFIWSSLDLLGQAANGALMATLRKSMPLEPLGEHGFPEAGALGTNEVEVLLDKAKTAATSVDFATRVEDKALVTCTAPPASPSEEVTCAQGTLRALAGRAYRRPVAPDEEKDLLQAFTDARQPSGATFLSALRTAIAALLTSPSFLYHDEAPTTGATAAKVVVLTDHELAARLAATLWKSIPDAAGVAAASTGSLRTDQDVATEVARMLADPRSQRGLMALFDEVLGTGSLSAQTRGGGPWDATIAGKLHDDLAQLVKRVVLDGDGRYESLLGQGLLSSGAVMAAQSKAGESSPIKRGRLIRERFLCDPIPPPPPNIPALAEAKTATNPRDRFIEHSRNPTCVGCHERMDPIGFAFSNYDQLGRLTDGKQDTSGQVVDLDGATTKFGDLAGLTSLIAHSPQAHQCFVTQWTRFALGRQIQKTDEAGAQAIAVRFDQAQGNIKALFQSVLQSTAFRMQEINQ